MRRSDVTFAALQVQAKRLRLTVEPDGPAGPAPLVMALHGNAGNAGREVDSPNRFVWNDLEPPEFLRRGYIVVGDADGECLRVAREVQSLLGDYGIPVELEVHPGMGHDYSETFEKSPERAISFLCQ